MTTLRDLLNDLIHDTLQFERERGDDAPEIGNQVEEDFIEDKLDEYTGYIKDRWVG